MRGRSRSEVRVGIQEEYWSCSERGEVNTRMGGLEVIQNLAASKRAWQWGAGRTRGWMDGSKKSSERRDPVTSQLGSGSEESTRG